MNNITDIKIIFGKNIKHARKARGISQEKFAELIEIGASSLSKIEGGKTFPSVQTIEKIIKVLNIKPYLLYVTDEEIDVDKAYSELIQKLDKLKQNKQLFKRAYDFITELTINL